LILKLLVLFIIAFTIYSNWLYLTVAADYLLEDYLKHPTVILIKERLSDGFKQTKKLTESFLKYGEEGIRSMVTNIEPYAVKLGQYIQKQWNLLLKYIEGPIADKAIEIVEQIRQLSIIIFKQSVHYLNILFDWASYYTANLVTLIGVYIQQVYAILYDKWTHFDASELQKKI